MAHSIPKDLQKTLASSSSAQKAWEDITPLARNEWICWVTSAKKMKTRERRIERTREELVEGKRRPCCWAGCPHRKDKPMNTSQERIFIKKRKN